MADTDEYSVSSREHGNRLRRPDMTLPRGTGVRAGIMVFSIVALSALSGFGGAWFYSEHNDTGVAPLLSNQKKIVSSESQLISQIAQTVGQSVVSVNQSQGAGTGVVISSKGIILTNRHVVPLGTTEVSVTLSDGTELKDVSVLGRTNDTDSLDIAFLKVNNLEGHKLTAAVIGDSSRVQVGDDAIAIGNALGQFQNTVTSGIISGYGRSVQAGGSSYEDAPESLDNLFQTDAAINQGNSGGPLVNLNGQVIGINTAVASDSENIGFAIPINDVRGLITQVLETGKFERPYLGVRYIPLTRDLAKQYKLSSDHGAFIVPGGDAGSSVLADSPAERAKLQENDIILSVDGTKVDQTHSLTSLLGKHKPGDGVTLSVMRDDKTISVRVTLGVLPVQR